VHWEHKGILHGYNRPLDAEWCAPETITTDPMLGVVSGQRTLEHNYATYIPPFWVQRRPLLRTSRIFWYADYLYITITLSPALPDWADMVWVISAGWELGVILDYWEKLKFDKKAVEQAWRDVEGCVPAACKIDRLDLLWHSVFAGLLAYPNHCGDFENRSVLELRSYELGIYGLGRAICGDHDDAMALGLVIGLGHDLLESGTDITNREEHNLWVALTGGCCCTDCLGALEGWLLKWLDADPLTAGHLTAWGFAGYFTGTWLSERHGIADPAAQSVPDIRRCNGAARLRKVPEAADRAGSRRVGLIERPLCGLHTAEALPSTLEGRRELHDRLTRQMISPEDGSYCGCLNRTFIRQLKAAGLRAIVMPWIQLVTPSEGHRINK
jgi:hypothetical protein